MRSLTLVNAPAQLYLMVPVGEGRGLIMLLKSFSGMVIFSGEICGYRGLTGDTGASSFSVSLWYSAVN